MILSGTNQAGQALSKYSPRKDPFHYISTKWREDTEEKDVNFTTFLFTVQSQDGHSELEI